MTCFDGSRFAIAPDVLHQELDRETILLHVGSGRYFGLNAVASRAWSLLEADGDPGRIRAQLLAEFAVDEATLSADLEALFADLLAAGLLQPVAAD